jgi:archaeal type IV pilus assembly protein PilA
MNTRKGISPLIATLLLIAIAVAASVLTYSWVMSMVGSQSAQAQTQVRIDNVNWYADGIIVMIRNTGSVAATLESITVRTNTAGSATVALPLGTVGNSYDTGAALGKSVAWSPYLVGTSYVVRVTTTTGFYYEAVVTSPAVMPTANRP